ncbi:MAG: hypothetical protein U1E05_08870 [Patescibacteria group bacterium]|nr:hypothetical protein [Patescibacteria group bacterium]
MNPLIRCLVASLLASLVVLAAPGWAETVVLYDPELGTLPDQQGWAYVTKPILIAKAKRSFANGLVRLDTTPVMDEWVGFLTRVKVRGIELSHPRMPDLDRKTGYTVRFHARVIEERHTGNDRAGFCIIAVGNDLQAIELDFWSDEIWAQSGPWSGQPNEPLFTHTVERTEVDTSQATTYELRVAGEEYSLWAGDRRLLAGPLRGYSSHWHPAYSQANTIFLGDNSSRASALVELGRVEVRGNPTEDSP